MEAQDVLNDQYWATKKDQDFIDGALSRVDEYHNYLLESNIYNMWVRSYVAYYGANLSSNKLGKMFEGITLEQDSKVLRIKRNHFRNVIKHTLQLTTAQRPAYQTRASNTDMKSQAQTILGAGLLDYYNREKHYGKIFSKATEYALIFTEGWVHSPWRKDIGEIYESDPETGEKIYEGDVDPRVHSPLAVIRDVEAENNDYQWTILEEYVNKWDLAEEYGSEDEEVKSTILNSSDQGNSSDSSYKVERFNWYVSHQASVNNRDKIKVFTFYHDPSPSIPNGRLVKFVDGIVLQDVELPYKRMPLRLMTPDIIMESPFNYSPAMELLGPQQGIDALSSALMTNNATNAVQKVWTKSGDNVSVTDLGEGITHMQSLEPPQGINLTASSPETFNLLSILENDMETLSGISSTVRGKPESNLKSGAALALVVSQSIQFASMLEESYNGLIENEGMDLIDKLRIFAKTPRIAAILGEASRPYQSEFTADDLSMINRVVVERGNALSKTVAGRIQLADTLLEKGLIENSKQYINVLTTGNIDATMEKDQYNMLNVRAENEELRKGNHVQAIVTEHHLNHMREHQSVLANPDAKKDPQLVALVTGHIQDHINLWRSMDPALMMMIGLQPPPPPPPMPPMPMGGMPPQPGPANGPSSAPVMQAPQGVNQADMPGQPNMPTNPLSGNKFNPQDGGL